MFKPGKLSTLIDRVGLIRFGFVLWLLTMAMTIAQMPLIIANLPHTGSLKYPDDYSLFILVLVNASVGFLIVRYQPRLAIGWLYLVLCLPIAVAGLAQNYAIFGLVTNPLSGLPGLVFAAWLQNWISYIAFPIPYAMLFLLFPNGRLPSSGWRWVVGAGLVILVVQVLKEMVSPGRFFTYIGNDLSLPILNPWGTRLQFLAAPVFDYIWFLSMIIYVLCILSLPIRFRKAEWVERQQLKWFLFCIILLIVLFATTFWGENTFLDGIAVTLLILMLPAGTAIAILRYNLYGIDVIIRRTVQYTLLTGTLAAIYFGLVLILQNLFTGLSEETSPLVLVISTLAIAALFNPLRLRILAFIDRRFFRSKYDSEKILGQFAHAVRSEVDLEQLSSAMVGTVKATLQPEQVNLWLSAAVRRRSSASREAAVGDLKTEG